MDTPAPTNRYKHHCFPTEIIRYGVCLYFRCCLSYRDVEELLLTQNFKSPGHAQRLLAAYGPIAAHFRPRRHVLPGYQYRQEMAKRFQIWWEITDMPMAASRQDEGQPSSLSA
jgi:hypothetical protein